MGLNPYPIYEGPQKLGFVPLCELSVTKARDYFTWFKDNYMRRIDVLLHYISDDITADKENDLLRIGEKITAILPLERFSKIQDKGYLIFEVNGKEIRSPKERVLTVEGTSIGIDMGCILAYTILSLSNRVKWHMPTRPKNYVDLHHPTLLIPGDKIPFNPITVSLTRCHGILNNRQNSDVWCHIYMHYKKLINSLLDVDHKESK